MDTAVNHCLIANQESRKNAIFSWLRDGCANMRLRIFPGFLDGCAPPSANRAQPLGTRNCATIRNHRETTEKCGRNHRATIAQPSATTGRNHVTGSL